MKTTHKQVLALFLTVALLLLLCACAQIQQLKGTDSATLPETLAGQASETQSEDPTQHSEITESQRAQHSEATEPQQAQYIGSEEGKNSLLRLRDKIDFSQTMFAMAYLGYVGGLFCVLIFLKCLFFRKFFRLKSKRPPQKQRTHG